MGCFIITLFNIVYAEIKQTVIIESEFPATLNSQLKTN